MNTTKRNATNSDVLKKYGRAAIMVRAWRTFKSGIIFLCPVSFAEALRQAWEGFRVAIDRIAADKARHAAIMASARRAHPNSLLARIASNPTQTKDAWGRNSSRYLNTVMGR